MFVFLYRVLNITRFKSSKFLELSTVKTVVIEKKESLPDFLPHGWKKAVAERIGVHQLSMSRILRNPKSPNYARVIKVAKELYGNNNHLK